MEILKQYELIKGSRAVMLNFIEQQMGEGYTVPIKEFNNKDIRYFLLHINNTYKHWGANFGMNKDMQYIDYNSQVNITEVRELFDETDKLVAEFLNHFKQSAQPATNMANSGNLLTVTPLELFTHMITHEFHHKGQIMTMCRLLGHIPPDTDVIRY
jgi:uncharacterized damage-inducible protein DinB